MSKFVALIEMIRRGEEPTRQQIDEAIDRAEQFEFYMNEVSRPDFIRDVVAPSEDEQKEADAEKDFLNEQNGYDSAGNIVAPIPESLR